MKYEGGEYHFKAIQLPVIAKELNCEISHLFLKLILLKHQIKTIYKGCVQMMKTIKEFKTSILKGPLARNEKLQSSAWAFMADIVRRQLNENGSKHIGKNE